MSSGSNDCSSKWPYSKEGWTEPSASPSPVPAYNSSRDDCISVSNYGICTMEVPPFTIDSKTKNLSNQSLLALEFSKMRGQRFCVSSQHLRSRASMYAAKINFPPIRYVLRSSDLYRKYVQAIGKHPMIHGLTLEYWVKKQCSSAIKISIECSSSTAKHSELPLVRKLDECIALRRIRK